MLKTLKTLKTTASYLNNEQMELYREAIVENFHPSYFAGKLDPEVAANRIHEIMNEMPGQSDADTNFPYLSLAILEQKLRLKHAEKTGSEKQINSIRDTLNHYTKMLKYDNLAD